MQGLVVGGDLWKYEVRSTKYEVAKLWRAVCGKEEGMVGRCMCGGKVGQSERERRGRWKAKGRYEVKEIGATELRGGMWRKRSRNDARGINQSTREDEAPLVRRMSATHVGISIAAFFRNFIGTGVWRKRREQNTGLT